MFCGSKSIFGSLGFKVLYTCHWNSDERTVRVEPAFLCTWLLQFIPFGEFSLPAALCTAPYVCCVQGRLRGP